MNMANKLMPGGLLVILGVLIAFSVDIYWFKESLQRGGDLGAGLVGLFFGLAISNLIYAPQYFNFEGFIDFWCRFGA